MFIGKAALVGLMHAAGPFSPGVDPRAGLND
jgi:hypothetical protein